MPIDNQQPQRDQDVVSYTKFSGLRNDVTPERFEPGDLDIAQNVDIDKTGRLARRAGFAATAITGGTHSLWANAQGTQAFYAQGTNLYQLAQAGATYSGTLLKTLTVAERISFEQVNDRVYFSNGVDAGVIEQGAVRSWGVAPPALPSVAFGQGAMPQGTYLFTMTYFRNDWQESGAPMAAAAQVPYDGAALIFNDLPVSNDPTVTAKAIYLTEPNGEDLYQAMVVPNALTSVTYANDTSEMDLPLESAFLQPAPAGQMIAFYRGRMFVAQGDTLYSSEPFAYERFDPRANMQLDGRITMLAAITDREMFDTGRSSGFFIGTDRSCGVLIGSSPEDFKYVPKTSYGAVFGAAAKVDGSVFEDGASGARELPIWLTTGGVCVGMPEMQIRNLTRTRFTFATGSQGAGLFMPGPNRLILTNLSA